MLITVTTTSTSMNQLLSPTDLANAVANYKGIWRGVVQNLGAQDIYVEWRAAATTTAGIKIIQNDFYTFEVDDLADLNLIANAAPNTDVRVSIN